MEGDPRCPMHVEERWRSEWGYSFRLFCLLHLLTRLVAQRRCCAAQPGKRPPRRILLRMLLCASNSARQSFACFASRGLQPHFHQKTLAMVGAALAFHSINRRSSPFRLQPFLKRRLVVAKGRPGTQLFSQFLDGVPHNITTRESPHRLKSAIEKKRA